MGQNSFQDFIDEARARDSAVEKGDKSNKSPIDIPTTRAEPCGSACDLTWNYKSSQAFVRNEGGELLLDYDPGSFVMWNGKPFELQRIYFTIPSSHRLDGSTFPMEAQLYHFGKDRGERLVISVFFEVNNHPTPSAYFLDSIKNFPESKGKIMTRPMPSDWNAFKLIPDEKAFYTYNGSLQKDVNAKNVRWVIIENPMNVPSEVYNKLKKILKINAPTIHKLNRDVRLFYNSNTAARNQVNQAEVIEDTFEANDKNDSKEKESKDDKNSKPISGLGISLIILGVISILVPIIFGIMNTKEPNNSFVDYLVNIAMVFDDGGMMLGSGIFMIILGIILIVFGANMKVEKDK